MKGISSRWAIGTVAFVSGVTLGIAAGLLWAPQSGKRTREDLQDLAHDTLDEAEDWVSTTKETFNEKFDDLMQKGKAVVG
jgi:gas vesicle protein